MLAASFSVRSEVIFDRSGFVLRTWVRPKQIRHRPVITIGPNNHDASADFVHAQALLLQCAWWSS